MLMRGASGCTSLPLVLRVTVQMPDTGSSPRVGAGICAELIPLREGRMSLSGLEFGRQGTVGRLPTNDPPVLAYCEPK